MSFCFLLFNWNQLTRKRSVKGSGPIHNFFVYRSLLQKFRKEASAKRVTGDEAPGTAAHILTNERRLGTRGRYISIASLVNFLRHRHTDLTAKEFRIVRRQTTDLFSLATSWNWHPREPYSRLLCLYQKTSQLLFMFLTFKLLIFLSSLIFIYLIYLSSKFIYVLFFAVRQTAVRRLLFLPLQSPAFLSEMVRSATQHCLCWPRKLTVLPKKGPIYLSLWPIPMLIAEVACWYVTFDVELSTRKLKSQLRLWRDWYAFGNSTTTLVIQSSSSAKSTCTKSNVDQWTWMLMDKV